MTPSPSPVNPSPSPMNPSPLPVNPKPSSMKQKLKKMTGSVTKMKEWLEEMEPDVGVVQNTKLEPKTETYEGYLPLEMNDARNNNVAREAGEDKKDEEVCNDTSYISDMSSRLSSARLDDRPRSIRESERWGLESADSLIVLGSMVHSLGGETREPKLEITGRIRKSQIPVCACVDKTG
ncbi:hypothetical protein CK203_028735 [Vitis vinifera]|uniref:Uncharacterized protein n=1 Tax=Vitis vinifera TaxID=29760 RepID=A0A438IG21_VITVI|nr:hypothetical protein CK203_028735 [Vitis vinifera]